MFDQIKNLYNLRKQAQELQRQLENEKITAASGDGLVTLTINGSHDLVDIKIDSAQELNASKLESAFRSAHKKASDELKSILAKKFQGML